MVIVSSKFMTSSLTSAKTIGYNRDASESFVLAESALNWLYGRFVYDGNIDTSDDAIDNQININLEDARDLANHYMYFVSDNIQINQTEPSVLQRVANGEGNNSNGLVNGRVIPETTATLLVDDLFTDVARPVVLFQTADGIQQSDRSWNQVPGNNRAAVWIELVGDPLQGNRIHLFVQSVAEVGQSRSYIQRYIGQYSDALGYDISALTEANPNPGNVNQ